MLFRKLSLIIIGCALNIFIFGHASAQIKAPNKPECIAPAQPGGGFDLSCRLIVNSLSKTGLLTAPMRTIYMPGGIGAVAFNNIVTQRSDDFNSLVVFSGGSLLNLALGKFGRYNANDVRWLAAIGADYGIVMVRDDSPYKDLKSLMDALKKDPTKVVLGAGGSIGSQDWMKAALIARAAGIDYKKMRFVAFEGGGESITALRGGHIQAYMGDAAEATSLIAGGSKLRILAVLHNKRLPGLLTDIPTAKEQGYDIQWPIIRGVYIGAKVSNEQYDWWLTTLNKLFKTPEFTELQKQQGLFPFDVSGDDLDKYIKAQIIQYTTLADSFGLIKK